MLSLHSLKFDTHQRRPHSRIQFCYCLQRRSAFGDCGTQPTNDKMPKCPSCQKEVYFAEKVTSLGKDWHRPCLRCARCKKTLNSGGHAEHEGKPYCHMPCYSALFGPKGFGHGGAESHKFN